MHDSKIAWHEAGHAVAAVHCGLVVASVTIRPPPDADAAGCLNLVPGQASERDLDFVWVNAGGIIADRLKRGRDDFTANTIRNWKRYGWLQPDIRILLDEFPDDSFLLDAVRVSVQRMRAHWPQVEAVAGELLSRRHLTGDELRTIMQAASPDDRG